MCEWEEYEFTEEMWEGRGRVGCPEHSFENIHPIPQTLPSASPEKIPMWVFPPELPCKCKYECYSRRASAARGCPAWAEGGCTACSSRPFEDLQTAGAKRPAPGWFHPPSAVVAHTCTFVGGRLKLASCNRSAWVLLSSHSSVNASV